MRHLKSFKKFENFENDFEDDFDNDIENSECAFCDGEGCTECDHGHEKRFSRLRDNEFEEDEFDDELVDDEFEDEFGENPSDLDEDLPMRERRNSRLSRSRRILEKKKAEKKEDDKKSKSKKSSKKECDDCDDEEKDKKSSKGLTAAQKKLPAGLQKAILARKKK